MESSSSNRAASTLRKLTETAIKAFPSPLHGQTFYWDSEEKGFGVRVTSRSKSFVLDRKLRGKTIRITIGRVGTWSVEQARREAKDLAVQIDKGNDPRQVHQKRASAEVTLGTAFTRFLSERPLKPRTVADYQRFMEVDKHGSRKNEFFGDWRQKPLVDLSEDMIVRKYQSLKAGKCGASQAGSAMRVLRSVINFAIQTYDLPMANPVLALSKRRAWIKDKQRRTHLHPEQIGPFVAALRTLPNPVVAAYLEFILFTGARRAEAAKLKWDDVDLNTGVLVFTDTKNGTDRAIPISSSVARILSAMQAYRRGPYVFSSQDKLGRPSHITEPKRALARANAAAGTGITVHDLRRTFATILENLDCPMPPLKALLGHSLSQDVTTGHYVVLTRERLRQWTDKYDAHITELVNHTGLSATMQHQ